MSKKVHLNTSLDERNSVAVCSGYYNTYSFKEFYNLPEEQQCKNCVKTKYYQDQEQNMERERKASSGELGVLFEVFKYKVESDRFGRLTYSTKCPYSILKQNGYIVSIGTEKGICTDCEHYRGQDKKLRTVDCSYKYDNKPEIHTIVENITIEEELHYKSALLMCEIKYKAEIDEAKSTKKYTFENDNDKNVFDKIVFLYHSNLEKREEKTWIGESEDVTFGTTGHYVSDTLTIDDSINKIYNADGEILWDRGGFSEDVAFNKKLPSKYHREYYSMSEGKSVVLDVYDKLAVMDLPNAEIEHTYKKIDRCGKGDKSLLEDLKEAREQLDMGIKRIEKELK